MSLFALCDFPLVELCDCAIVLVTMPVRKPKSAEFKSIRVNYDLWLRLCHAAINLGESQKEFAEKAVERRLAGLSGGEVTDGRVVVDVAWESPKGLTPRAAGPSLTGADTPLGPLHGVPDDGLGVTGPPYDGYRGQSRTGLLPSPEKIADRESPKVPLGRVTVERTPDGLARHVEGGADLPIIVPNVDGVPIEIPTVHPKAQEAIQPDRGVVIDESAYPVRSQEFAERMDWVRTVETEGSSGAATPSGVSGVDPEAAASPSEPSSLVPGEGDLF